jgi:hypothetical protein
MAQQYLADRNGWLSFSSSTPVLYITSEDEEFDVETMRAWRDEGFIVKYIPMNGGGKQYIQTLNHLGDKMGFGDRYAIVGQQHTHYRPRMRPATADPPQHLATLLPSV